MTIPLDVMSALGRTNREVLSRKTEQAESARQTVLEQFPLAEWPAMPLKRYAMGTSPDDTDGRPPFCTVMEFRTDALAKHMIYWHNSGEWKFAAPLWGFGAEHAWQLLRDEFVTAFSRIDAGDLDAIDELKFLHSGASLVTKTFHTYFPQSYVAVYGQDHLHHFIKLLGEAPMRGAASWSLNRQLRSQLEEVCAAVGLSQFEAVRALYMHFPPPRDPKVFKIAPGRNAVWWDWCLDRSVIGVGWNQVGDLTQYASDVDLREALDSHVKPSKYNPTLARCLLDFRDLRSGDQIVANGSEREILGLGTVTGAYVHEPRDGDYPWNLVEVEWDTDCAVRLDEPEPGWRRTFGKVRPELLKRLRKSASSSAAEVAVETPAAQKLPEVPGEIQRVIEASRAKGQVILHGPPGTGKTRFALRAALALAGAYPEDEASVPGAIEQLLADGSRAMLTTFHPSYGYEDFIEGFKPVLTRDGESQEGGLKLSLRSGLFLDACEAARRNPDEPYTLVIDEINRGDMPRVFGELITMLELDKRRLSIRLPVSGKTFSIPENLRIIATLNSADHSITSLDLAIRRRFSFVRLDPDPDVLTGSVDALDLAALLRELNARIRTHLGHDLEIGHAYFLRDDRPLDTAADLESAFYNELVPLMEEYTFDRPEMLARLLGSLIDQRTGSVKTVPASDLADALASEFARDGDE
jgi:5-methylcytosine-specific restriction protein B